MGKRLTPGCAVVLAVASIGCGGPAPSGNADASPPPRDAAADDPTPRVPDAHPIDGAPRDVVGMDVTATIPPPSITSATAIAVSAGPPMDYDSAFFLDPMTGDWVVVIDRFTAMTLPLQAQL